MRYARTVRGSTLVERGREYVQAARVIGRHPLAIMFTHVLPNAVAPLLIQISLSMGFAVLAESALTFLGLGTQPPMPSWGGMLSAAAISYRKSAKTSPRPLKAWHPPTRRPRAAAK